MEPPVKPDEGDCCNTGCTPCILDVYEEQLKKWKESKETADIQEKVNCMCLTTYSVFRLIEIIPHTKNTNIYVFKFIKPLRGNDDPNLEKFSVKYMPGQHFLIRGQLSFNSEQFTKAYTPIPYGEYDRLTFVVLIKLYEEGVMSRYIRRLKVNSNTVWRGPYGDFKASMDYKNILCIAQGTGIAPIFSVIKSYLENDDCESFITLYFCCRSIDEIHLHDEIYKLASYWNFNYELFISNTDNIIRKYREVVNAGRLDVNIIESYLDKKGFTDTQILICGSTEFNTSFLENILSLRFPKNNTYVF